MFKTPCVFHPYLDKDGKTKNALAHTFENKAAATAFQSSYVDIINSIANLNSTVSAALAAFPNSSISQQWAITEPITDYFGVVVQYFIPPIESLTYLDHNGKVVSPTTLPTPATYNKNRFKPDEDTPTQPVATTPNPSTSKK